MERNLYSCPRAGRTIFEKTMEDGNNVNRKDDNITTASLTNLYGERPAKLTANGHEFAGEPSSLPDDSYERCHTIADNTTDDKFKKRINPLRIHLGKRPFVDNSLQYYNSWKKKKPSSNKSCDNSNSTITVPRVPKLIPKHRERSQFHNVISQADSGASDRAKPVPRLVPKNQLLQFKKSKTEKGAQLNEYAQSLGLQPMVKFKCRKCCSMSFKTLAMLKEHQLVCRAQAKEPALSPEAAPTTDVNTSGPSRVTRKVYLCSACGTYYENWNLFLHMREVHNRHICLFCLGMFSKAEKLASHLISKHNVKEFNYDNKEDFLNEYKGTLYLMCCVCDEICSDQDDFFNHDCNNIKPKPVPVLISKNSVKPVSLKNVLKTPNEVSTNGLKSIENDSAGFGLSHRKDMNEGKVETVSSQIVPNAPINESSNSDTSFSSGNSILTNKDTSSTVESAMELEHSEPRPVLSSIDENSLSPERCKQMLQNGDENLNHSDESDSAVSDDIHETIKEALPVKSLETSCPPIEKECGIKLKLSLNNAKSPVIINSTVDPSIGLQNIHKPPSRVRRPPKRYEKDKSMDLLPVAAPTIPKTPTIKMTICDRADSPFVKTIIYENSKETTLKTLLNNNLETAPAKTPEIRAENTIKTTIYDNKLDDAITFNKVPKLTVRLPKELLDKDSSSEYSSDSDVSDKLTLDESNTTAQGSQEPKTEILSLQQPAEIVPPATEVKQIELPSKEKNLMLTNELIEVDPKTEPKSEPDPGQEEKIANLVVEEPTIPVTELSLNKPLDKYPLKDLLKVFLSATVYNCIYCNHVRKIAVNCEQLALHMVAQHRFSATVDSITAEELMPETITAKLKMSAPELKSVYINLDSYDSVDKCENVQYDYMFECFQCYFKTAIHKDLYLHNRKMHQKTILLCIMCKSNFYSYSELLCHLCPGTYDSEYEIAFRCCLCNVDSIPSPFRLMVHLRKIHHTCDVCLELCHNQARLSNHVWKHKLHHLCYRCGIAYRNKPDITNHLFWKHGTESVLCKKCMQKKWPHVYHFCTPPAIFLCDECNLQFSRAVYLKVHKRFHSNNYPHECTEEGCTEKFVSKKLLNRHLNDHKKKLMTESFNEEKPFVQSKIISDTSKESIPTIDLVNEKELGEVGLSDKKVQSSTAQLTKKAKKKKQKDKDALLLDVNLPALNLSESDSSDQSDSGISPTTKEERLEEKSKEVEFNKTESVEHNNTDLTPKIEDKVMLDDNPNEQRVLDIWDNFKKYQAKVEKHREKTPPLVPIRKHVCESDHDYCLIPIDMNGDEDLFNSDKKKSKKSPKKQGGLSSSSSSSSDSGSSCSSGSNCSTCNSGSSSSSTSDSDSSDSGNDKRKTKRLKKTLPNRRISTGSNVDVMGVSETPILIPEKTEPPIAETDLETNESETDEEFYDKNPQIIANKLKEEKRNQLILPLSVIPSDSGSISGEISRPSTPAKEEKKEQTPACELEPHSEHEPIPEIKVKSETTKKKSKKKKKSKNSKKHAPIKINIPKDAITKTEVTETHPLLFPNKITISLQSNTVQIPEPPKPSPIVSKFGTPAISVENKRASKRRRVPNKFYGYSSDEETPHTPTSALKPQQPPKLEWRKEDLPSPVTHKAKKEVPSTVIPSKLYNYTNPIRLTAPIPDPEPPRLLMNSESMESSDSDSSDGSNLEIYHHNSQNYLPPPPTYLNSGTSSLPYPFQRPAVREAREGESVYCYCRCPYDEVSEMIACDAEGCPIEWFHFECVGIMVPPKGKWYCPECRKNQSFSGYR